MTYVRCPSPTCEDRLQDFTDLKGGEIPAAEAALLHLLENERFVAKAFHRCRNGGCRRVQKKTMWWVGDYLPKGF